MQRLTPLLLLVLLLAGCGAALPPEATSVGESAAKALQSEDHTAFAQTVLPAQREGALGLPAGYPIDAGKEPNELTLQEVLQIEFFNEIKEAKVSLDYASLEDESNARLGIEIDYDDGSFTVKSFLLKKEGEKWYIDFKETLKHWHTMDGAAALSVTELK